MYQALLTRRYLLSKIMPLLSAIAVMLCTAMVLVTWSIMGGFLNMLLASGRSLMGDVSIEWSTGGMPYYRDLIKRLEDDPSIECATPVIESLGLVTLPSGNNKPLMLVGVEPEEYNRVTGFFSTIHWKPLTTPLPRDKEREDLRLDPLRAKELAQMEQDGRALSEVNPQTGLTEPAVILGAFISGSNNKTAGGFIDPYYEFMPNERVSVGVLPRSQRNVPTSMSPVYASFPVANEFNSGMFLLDSAWIIMPLSKLQEMIDWQEAPQYDESWKPGGIIIGEDGQARPEPPPIIGKVDARVSNVLIRAVDGATPEQVEVRAEDIFKKFADDHGLRLPGSWQRNIYTWDKKPNVAVFVAQVRKETSLVLVLFFIISLTSVFLVLAIFWAMVSEKTKDIGVLRAIGASRGGIVWLWLRYGLAIGLLGSVSGGILAWLVVHNINEIHDWLGRTLGIIIWSPETYVFSEIPSKVEPDKAAMVLAVGVLSSVVGALIPALRAAWLDPVKALRFE